jgi:hypothetical protein
MKLVFTLRTDMVQAEDVTEPSDGGWALADWEARAFVRCARSRPGCRICGCLEALDDAVARRAPGAGLIHHSDYAEVCVKPRNRGLMAA